MLDVARSKVAKLKAGDKTFVNERFGGEYDNYKTFSIGLCTEEAEAGKAEYLKVLKAALAKDSDDGLITLIYNKK